MKINNESHMHNPIRNSCAQENADRLKHTAAAAVVAVGAFFVILGGDTNDNFELNGGAYAHTHETITNITQKMKRKWLIN